MADNRCTHTSRPAPGTRIGMLAGEMHAKLVGYVVSGGPGLKPSTVYAWASELRGSGLR
jgi:hypothetical protein